MAQPTVHLVDVRLDAVDEADLRWLFCRAAGEMGERSSLGAMIDRLNEGRTHTGQSGTPDLPTSQYLAAAAQRARSPPDWSTSASATPARSKPPTAPVVPRQCQRFRRAGQRRHPCPTPWCLAATRARIPYATLDGWLTPRPAPSARHRGQARSRGQGRQGPPRRACRAVVDQWRSQGGRPPAPDPPRRADAASPPPTTPTAPPTASTRASPADGWTPND